MRKRLALARLFLKAPELALLDEPFGELDPEGIADVERAVKELRAAGTTLVLATHQIQQGLSLCDQRLHLETGRSVAA
jgi:heme exporter protein A